MKTGLILKSTIVSFILLLAYSCSEDKLDTFTEKKASIYFSVIETINTLGNTYKDVTTFSFETISDSEYELKLPIGLMGFETDETRNIDFEIVANSTAKPNVHYTIKGSSIEVLPGQTEANIVMTLLRDASLQESDFELEIKLKPNKWFDLSPIYEYSTNDTIVLNHHKVIITGKVLPPDMRFWTYNNLFGDYSVEKHLLINKLCGITSTDWERPNTNMLSSWWVVTRQHLQKCYDLGEPVLEKNGEIMRVKGLMTK